MVTGPPLKTAPDKPPRPKKKKKKKNAPSIPSKDRVPPLPQQSPDPPGATTAPPNPEPYSTTSQDGRNDDDEDESPSRDSAADLPDLEGDSINPSDDIEQKGTSLPDLGTPSTGPHAPEIPPCVTAGRADPLLRFEPPSYTLPRKSKNGEPPEVFPVDRWHRSVREESTSLPSAMIQEQAGVAGPQPGQVRVGTPPCDHPEEPTPLAAQTNKDSNNLVLTVGASEDPSADEPPKKDAQSDPAPAPVFSDQQIEEIITGDFPGLPDCPPMWDIEDRLHPIAPQDIAAEMQRLLAIRTKREPPELLKEVCTHLGRSLSSHEVNVLCAQSDITDPAEWVTWFEDTLAVCEEARKANRDFTVHSMEVAAIAPWFSQLRALPKPLIGAVID